MLERVILPSPLPHALRRFKLVSTFYHWAAKLHLCTSTLIEAIGSKREKRTERDLTHFSLFLRSSLHQCQPKPFRLYLREKVINFIYTLIRSLDKNLSLWIASIKGFTETHSVLAVEILMFDCHSIRRGERKTWGYSFTSFRLRPCMVFLWLCTYSHLC